MDSVLGLAAFALVWAGIVHLGKKQNWSGRKRHWMGFLAALLVAGAIGSAFAPVDQTPPPSAEASSPEPPESASKTETAASMDGDQQPVIGQGLGLSLDAYMSGINESIVSTDLEDRARDPLILPGEVADVAQLELGPNRTLSVRLKKGTREVLGATLIASGDGSFRSGGDIVIVAIASAAGAVPPGKRMPVYNAVMSMIRDLVPDGPAVTRDVEGMHLSLQTSSLIGTLFTIEASKGQ